MAESFSNQKINCRLLFDKMLNGFAVHEIICDDKGIPINYRFLDVNPAFERLTGLKKKDIIGKTVLEVLPDTEKYWIEKYGHVALTGESIQFEEYSKALNKYFEVVAYSPQKGKFAVIFSDITERKKSEEELKLAKKKAEEANELKSKFLANISHEIRTPMNGILGFINLLSMTKLNDEQKEFVHFIKSSALHLLKIINDILDFSKLEAGKLKLCCEIFEPIKLIKETTLLMSEFAKAKKLSLNYSIDATMYNYYKLIGDPLRIKQILINLISNAIKFTEVGHINVNLEFLELKDNKVWVKFSVEDTGIGILEDKVESIFESFNQLDNIYTKKYEGTGLGLSIVKHLVEMMNGKIIVKSKLNVGSCFDVILPFELASNFQNQDKLNIITNDLNIKLNSKILIVEDNNISYELLKLFLNKLNLNYIDRAESGKIALEMLEIKKYDLVLVDLQLPDISGFDIIKQTKENINCINNKTPLIVVTAHTLYNDYEKCLKNGADDFIAKPIDFEILKMKLKQFLGSN